MPEPVVPKLARVDHSWRDRTLQIIENTHNKFADLRLALLCEQDAVAPFYQPGNLAYYREYFACQAPDQSFCIAHARPLLLVQVTMNPRGYGDYYGLPSLWVWHPHCTAKERVEAVKLAFRHIQQRLGEVPLHYEEAVCGPLSEVALTLLRQGQAGQVLYRQQVDLQQDEAQLLAECRKVFRGNILKGQSLFRLRCLNQQTLQPGEIDAFQQLHIQVAGKATRSAKTWALQEAMIRQGEAFALYGYLDDKLVAAGLFPCNAWRCYYGVGAYERALFDKPLSHVMVWEAMREAKRMGCRHFDLGDRFFAQTPKADGTLPSDKELSISHFKTGFGGDTQAFLSFYPL